MCLVQDCTPPRLLYHTRQSCQWVRLTQALPLTVSREGFLLGCIDPSLLRHQLCVDLLSGEVDWRSHCYQQVCGCRINMPNRAGGTRLGWVQGIVCGRWGARIGGRSLLVRWLVKWNSTPCLISSVHCHHGADSEVT
jgi:hypothetical protein